jgi:hypothetical protein
MTGQQQPKDPHPQRCETCNPKCQDYLVLKKQERIQDFGHSKQYEHFTALHGCASHSAAQSEKVLEWFTKKIALKHGEMVDLMRRNNLIISDLQDPMQKLAFTFFSEIGEMSHEAEVILEELRQQTKERE